jgi:hypothetical protein
MKANKLGLIALCAMMLASCGGAKKSESVTPTKTEETPSSEPAKELTRVEKIVAEAETLSREELFKKAAAELGDKTFHWLATSSRGGKVKDKFVAALNAAAGTSITDKQIDYQTTVDGKIYTFLNAEVESGNATYSGALLQDGYQLQTKGIENGYVNYVPKEWADHQGVKKERDANPFSLQFNFKTWMYNNKAGDMVIDNVWDFAKEGVTIDTMDPQNENVNMDWLIQLTSDENCAILKAAFEDSSNSSGLAAADLEAYANYGESRKYAFLFIERFIKNAVFYADDGKALDTFKVSPGHAAWIVYSKIQNVTESADISKKDIVIAALGKENADGKNATMSIKGFGGFMYKHYLMLTPESPLPWTACAFINYLSTTKDGYSKWAGDVGDYPTYGEEINVDRTMNGHGTLAEDYKWTQDKDQPNVFPCLNDPNANWWIDTAKSVVETPSYIAKYYNTVAAFIMQQIAKK